MVDTASQNLDADELLHLGLSASGQGKHEDAIASLKRALALNPKDARIHYMLGAEHAQIGMYDRAIQEMTAAIELDPNLDTAHFQIGLIHITSGRVEPAADAWQALDKLGASHPLYLFKTGLLHLARDEFDDCVECLRRGIAANTANLALNKDMERIIKEVENRGPATPPTAAGTVGAPPPTSERMKSHVLLSTYRKNRGDDKDD